MTLVEGDGEPVVGGALGEGGDEHDEADEQGARLGPGGLGPDAGIGLMCGGGTGRGRAMWQQGRESHEGADDHEHGNADHVPEDAHAGPGQGGADEGGDHGATREGCVEVRHDRAVQVALDVRAFEVHPDIPRADTEAGENEPEHEHAARGSHVDAQADDHDAGRRGDHAGEDDSAQTEALGQRWCVKSDHASTRRRGWLARIRLPATSLTGSPTRPHGSTARAAYP